MRLRTLLHIVRRNAAYNRGRTLLYLIGTAAVTALLAFVLSGAHVTLTYFEERKLTLYGDYHVLVAHASRDQVTEAAGEDLARAGAIYSYGSYEITRGQGPSLKGMLGAFDADAAALARMEYMAGRAPQGPDEIALEQGVYLRLRQGGEPLKSVTVALAGNDGVTVTKDYAVSGVYRNISDVWTVYSLDYALPSIITAPQGIDGADTAVLVKFKAGLNMAACYQRLCEKADGTCNPNDINFPQDEPYDQNAMYVERFSQMALTLGVLLLFTLFVCAMQAAKAMLRSRSRQYDIMRSLGGKRRDIIRLSALETAWVWLLALPVSLAAGYALSWLAVWAASRTLNTDVPFFISGYAAAAVTGLSLLAAFAAWALALLKPKKPAPRKRQRPRLAGYAVRRAAMGKRRGFHAAALGSAAACVCFLILPYFTSYLLHSISTGIDGYQYWKGDFILARDGAGYSSNLYISDRMTTYDGLEYGDIQRLRGINEVESVAYAYEEDYLKLIVDEPELMDKDAVFVSLINRSQMLAPEYKSQYEQEKSDNGYGKEELAFCTLSGVEEERLEALRGKLTDGALDMEKLMNGSGVLMIDVSDVEGDEGVFPAGKRVTLSQLTEDSLNPMKVNRADITPEVVGTVSLSREEMKQYFDHTYSDSRTEGLGIRFLWGAPSFEKSGLTVTAEYVSAKLKDPYDYDEVQAFMDDCEAQVPGIMAISRPVAAQMYRGLTAIVDALGVILSLSMGLAGMMSLGLALYGNMLGRGREHGILRSLGAPKALLARLYMESGAGIALLYTMAGVVAVTVFHIVRVIAEIHEIKYFWEYMQLSGSWYRSALYTAVMTLSAGLVGALLYRRRDRSISEEVRYE